ncbi:translation initiation factor IF-2 [Patescibacteria group bacterium]|nr:translation initiation factor IF-2 [Patescibacteria group bacterium]
MNVTELARRLRVTPQELLAKLPELGFDIGGRAIKVDDRVADQIYKKWLEQARRVRLRDQLVRQQSAGVVTGDGAPRAVELPTVIAVRDFAGKLNLPVTRVIQQLMKAGILASQNERIDFMTASIIAEELGFAPKAEDAEAKEVEAVQDENRMKEVLAQEGAENMKSRPPVVVIMGHVDHGKTKTLDAIRKTHVVEGESGGITQHIGAYQVEKHGRKITFIDTPGHEAFTVMRSRGAKVADIAVLVVAADDGVQPQTKEAADIIKAAKLPFIVALNKMDKPEADPNRVLGQLAEIGVTVEEWGGTVPIAKISAKSGLGIDALLDTILLVADVEQSHIVANPKARAAGTIIESHVDKGEGPVATVVVQNGTLQRNDWLGIDGAAYGRVRSLRDWRGQMVDIAEPGMPVKVLGFKIAPAVGDVLEVPENPRDLEQKKMKTSRQVAETLTATHTQANNEEASQKKTLHVILKTDVLGSLEALLGMFEKIRHELVAIQVIQKGLGNLTDADIERAAGSEPSVVYGFNVMMPTAVEAQAREKGVAVHTYKIIYELFDDAVARLNALLPQEVLVIEHGKAEVAAIFRTESGKMIVGVRVKEGKLVTGAKVRVWRGEELIGDGLLETLQSGKTTVKELSAGTEGGTLYKGKIKLQAGDRLEAYTEEMKAHKIETFRA